MHFLPSLGSWEAVVGEAIQLTVNGRAVSVAADEQTPLIDVLRNHLGLKGTRFGCGLGQCGSCDVLVDGRVVPACTAPVGSVAGKAVVTVEGLGTAEHPHPLQSALIEEQAGQCGFCLSGILIGAKALLDRNPRPTRAEIAKVLDWHLCRCGMHNRIFRAVARAAAAMREEAAA
jgi:nicotinate dehydrogenase subunit A